jgi:hypothetical protein
MGRAGECPLYLGDEFQGRTSGIVKSTTRYVPFHLAREIERFVTALSLAHYGGEPIVGQHLLQARG